eukprot:5588167-Prymnesium_polylepis.1
MFRAEPHSHLGQHALDLGRLRQTRLAEHIPRQPAHPRSCVLLWPLPPAPLPSGPVPVEDLLLERRPEANARPPPRQHASDEHPNEVTQSTGTG